MRPSLFALTLPLAVGLALGDAWAQYGPGTPGMRPMGPGAGPTQGPEQKEEGPAEAAPENAGQEPAGQPLPAWPGQREKALQFFQLNGYFRGRTYLFHNFNLGIWPVGNSGALPPFAVPYSEIPIGTATNPASCAAREGDATCRSSNITSSDIRMRLEPTINVSEQVRVKAQIDVFDNLVFGSTPEGYYLNGLGPANDARIPAFSRTQVAPEIGRNVLESAIRVKRAWAEVRTPIGELRFGRMPSHWGTGILVNNGDCLDCDYGVNADRVMFSTRFWNHFVALFWDWVAVGPTTRLFTPNQSNGPFYNADPLDDVSQWGLAIGRQDKPEEIKERLDRGDLVLNYGGYFVYRRQSWDLQPNPGQNNQGGVVGTTVSPESLGAGLVPRDAWAFIPDLWFKLAYRKFQLEAEAVLVAGRINSINDIVPSARNGFDILQFGGVVRANLRLLRDSLHLGMEVGYASGDAQEDPNARINFREAVFLGDKSRGATTIGRFNFDPDYHVDLILFRRILGTVYNATYFKPSIAYDLTESLSARADVIYAIANNPVAFPGNSTNLGIEIDASVMYRNEEEGFYAGIVYGVLFPLGALNIPGEIYGPAFAKEAEAAQTVQGRLVVKF